MGTLGEMGGGLLPYIATGWQ